MNLLGCCLSLGLGAGAAAPADPRPNVLVIVLDDIGNDYVDLYGEGPVEDQPKTRVMDSMARQGVYFTNAYSQPVCSPTRGAFLTGRYGFRTGLTDNVKKRDFVLPLRERTLPEELRRGGYTTAMLGKWHLGDRKAFLDPVLHGYQLFHGTKGNLSVYHDFKQWTAWEWATVKSDEPRYGPIEMTDAAISLVGKLPEPWFLCVSHHLVHRPIHVPPVHMHSYGADPGDDQERFEAMVEATDHEVGRLLAEVDLKTTTVILFGDNGTANEYSEWRQAKGTCYEPGVNVPLIALGAGVPQRGARSDSLVNILDCYATILELAGLESPAEDSVSMLPIFRDPGARTRGWVYSELRDIVGEGSDQQMARDERYKLIRFNNVPLSRFYDLGTAPPNWDGDPLCQDPECADILTGEQLESYEFLSALLDTIRDS